MKKTAHFLFPGILAFSVLLGACHPKLPAGEIPPPISIPTPLPSPLPQLTTVNNAPWYLEILSKDYGERFESNVLARLIFGTSKNYQYSYTTDGSSTNTLDLYAWVVDSKVEKDTLLFGDRVTYVAGSSNKKAGRDNHGTQVAAFLGGKDYGVAQGAKIRSVYSDEGIERKLEILLEDIKERKQIALQNDKKFSGVVNFSNNWPETPLIVLKSVIDKYKKDTTNRKNQVDAFVAIQNRNNIQKLLEKISKENVSIVLAAGNKNELWTDTSHFGAKPSDFPSSINLNGESQKLEGNFFPAGTIVVGATEFGAPYALRGQPLGIPIVSRYAKGQYVDLYAPGENLLCKDELISGTSFSAPLVSGYLLRLYQHYSHKGIYPNPAQIKSLLLNGEATGLPNNGKLEGIQVGVTKGKIQITDPSTTSLIQNKVLYLDPKL